MSGPVDEIKARINAVELISETVKLRRSGRTFTGLCPFHVHTKNTPSFVVWPESGTWKCFGQCNEGGDIFKFVMKKENWGFREALEFLAGRAGVELKQRTQQDVEREEEYKRLRDLLTLSVTYYQNLLVNAPQAQTAREHLQKRGLKQTTIETFELGYALPAWEAAQKFFAERGFSQKEMLDAGLIVQRDDGSTRDRFRNRLMIPIRDGQGKIVGFGARALDPDDQPKFLNSPQTPLFNKGETVYALDRARKAISAGGAAVLVEGYMDVMAAHQAGFANVVSAMGTALTETQLRLIKKFAKRIVLALDADVAGNKAVLRSMVTMHQVEIDHAEEFYDEASRNKGLPSALDTSGPRLGKTFSPVPYGPNSIRYISKLQTDVLVFSLPEGLDPDDLVKSDPDAWKLGVAEAVPLLEFVIRSLIADVDINDPKAKSEAVDEMLPIISNLEDLVVRDNYLQLLARLLRVDERVLVHKAGLPKLVGRTSSRKHGKQKWPLPDQTPPPPDADWEAEAAPPAEESPFAESAVDRLESYCLGALVRHPDLVAKADRQLRVFNLPPLAADDFSHTDFQIIFMALKVALDQDQLEPNAHMSLHLEESLARRLQSLMNDSEPIFAEEQEREDDVLFAVIRLRARGVNSALNEVRFLQQEAQDEPELAEVYQNQVVNLSQARQNLRRAHRHYTSRMERLGKTGVSQR